MVELKAPLNNVKRWVQSKVPQNSLKRQSTSKQPSKYDIKVFNVYDEKKMPLTIEINRKVIRYDAYNIPRVIINKRKSNYEW